MTRGKKEREKEKKEKSGRGGGERERERLRDYSRQTADISPGVRKRQTNGWRTSRGCILRLVNGGGRPRGGSAHLRPNRSHRSVAL